MPARARSMAREFSSAMEDAAKASGLEDAAKTLKDVNALGSKKALGLDALVARTGLDAATLQVRLLELELDGRVARLPGGLFQRLGAA